MVFHLSEEATIEEEDTLQEPAGMLIVNRKTPIPSNTHNELRSFNAHVKDDIVLSTSHATSAGVLTNFSYYNTYQASQLLCYSSQSYSRAAAQSADTYFLSSNGIARIQSRPKALTNPFAPASIRIPMVPGRRRWAHTFPIGPNKIPWHFHHLRQMEGAMKQEMLLNIANCAHLVLPGTSKQFSSASKVKRINQHSKTNSDLSSRPKR